MSATAAPVPSSSSAPGQQPPQAVPDPAPAPDLSYPTIRLAKCTLRRLQPSDAPAQARAANDLEVSRWMRNTFPSPYTLRDAETWASIAPPLNLAIAVSTGDGGDVSVGCIGLRRLPDIESCTMELGYWVGREYWGRGVVADAVRGLCRWAFENLPDVTRIEAGTFVANERSGRVLERTGFTYEGMRRRCLMKRGEVMDMKMFSLLREECLHSEEG